MSHSYETIATNCRAVVALSFTGGTLPSEAFCKQTARPRDPDRSSKELCINEAHFWFLMFRITSKWLIAKFQTNVVQHIGLYSEQLVLYTLAQMLRMEELNDSDGRVGSDGRWFGWKRGKWFGWMYVKWFGWMWKCTAKCIVQTVVFLCYMCRSTKPTKIKISK